jgi:ATP-grasp domain-containing protein
MWWPLSARLATALIRHGCQVFAVCPPGHPLRFITGLEAVFPYRGLNSIGSLNAAILAARPALIVPCDDSVVWQLHELHTRNADLQFLIERSVGAETAYPVLRSRAAFLQAAAELGIRVPATRSLTSEKDLDVWCADRPAVLKRDGTWGGDGVSIVHSLPSALAAFRRLSQPIGVGTAWKRYLINLDPVALWSWKRRESPRITFQEFVPGRPANSMIACWQGELLGIVSVEVLTSQGATGAATVVRLMQNEEMERAAQLLARQFMLSGFHGLDFVLDQKTDAAYLIEINPRCTQLGHLRLANQGDLAGALSAKLWNQPIPAVTDPQGCLPGETVAFFPQAIQWNPRSPYLRYGKHDVPWEEPALVLELLRGAWPERKWLSRIYHHYRTPSAPEEVNFEPSRSRSSREQRV